jgi:glutamate-ammonia-ligase adenylyltransferase
LVNERRFALGVQLIDRRDDPLNVAAGYAQVAEGALLALADAAAAHFQSVHGVITGSELVILGLGRLGGRALTHASDLDLIYLFTGTPDRPSNGPKPLGPADYFNRLASRVTAALSVPTAAGPLYEVYTRLRPEGAEVAALVGKILSHPRDLRQVAGDAEKMRAEMLRHKPPAGSFDVKLGPGGLVDLEFAVHVLQLTHHVGLEPRLDEACSELAAAGLIDANVVDAQRLLTRMLVMMRLVAPDRHRPNPDTWALVAGACGLADRETLLAAHGAARQSIGALWSSIKEQADD